MQGGCAGHSLLAAEPRSAAPPVHVVVLKWRVTKLLVCTSQVCLTGPWLPLADASPTRRFLCPSPKEQAQGHGKGLPWNGEL